MPETLSIEAIRKMFTDAGLGDVDELTLARAAKGIREATTDVERVGALMRALGAPPLDAQAVAELSRAAEHATTKTEFVDAIFIGPCPACGSERTSSCEEVPGLEDPTVGNCLACGHRWCSECGEKFTGADCQNPDCWLNQDPDDVED